MILVEGRTNGIWLTCGVATLQQLTAGWKLRKQPVSVHWPEVYIKNPDPGTLYNLLYSTSNCIHQPGWDFREQQDLIRSALCAVSLWRDLSLSIFLVWEKTVSFYKAFGLFGSFGLRLFMWHVPKCASVPPFSWLWKVIDIGHRDQFPKGFAWKSILGACFRMFTQHFLDIVMLYTL